MGAFLETVKNLGMMRMTIMGSVVAVLAGFLFMISTRISGPDMALLYSDLSPSDGGQIVSRLEFMNVPMDVRSGETQIFAPSDQVPRIRMTMAEAGLPNGGSLGHEIFDKVGVPGSTSFAQNINRVRVLEEELSQSIRSITSVSSARVHLVLPKHELFSQEAPKPSAFVILRMRGEKLSPPQVVAVQHLVAAAVAGLAPGHISIIDERGTLLSRGNGSNEAAPTHGLEEAQRSYEDRMARTVETLLERSLGTGKVRAKVTAELDRNRTTENSELYDPDGQVVRSSQSSEESGQLMKPDTSDVSSIAANTPRTGAGSVSDSESTRTEEKVNYEISRTVRRNIKESGGVNRISVAVLVDGTYAQAEDGSRTYAPRPQEELNQLTRLVQSAVGFNEERGDNIEVINMQFAELPDFEFSDTTDWLMGFTRHDVMRFTESIILAVVALLALLFGVRPIINRLLSGSTAGGMQLAVAGGNADGEALMRPNGKPMVVSRPEGSNDTQTERSAASQPAGDPKDPISGEELAFSEGLEGTLERKNIIGRMKSSSIKKIEGLIDENTNEAVSQVRGWLGNEGE